MITGLEVVGPFRGWSGYDRFTREFVRHFVRSGVKVQLKMDEDWSIDLPNPMREPWFESLLAPVGSDTVLHFAMPNRVRTRASMRNINYTMFETDRIPADWVRYAREQALVVVSTRACREAWIASGVSSERVRVSPLGVDANFFSSPCEPLPSRYSKGVDIFQYSHRFLNIAEPRPRKNQLGLLRAWMSATRPNDDAILILKGTSHNPGVVGRFMQDLATLQAQSGCRLEEAAPVLFIMEVFSDESLRQLYRAATHYISLSRGEGWDLVMMEAAISGLQLIAPRHTAYLDYLDDTCAELIPATLVAATFEGLLGVEDRPCYEGMRWWQPDEEAAAAIIRNIIDDRIRPKECPQARLAASHSWENAACQLLSVIEAA